MAVVLNTAQSVSDFAVTTKSLNYTCGASDTRLVVLVGTDVSPGSAPSSVTYNGVGMTSSGSYADTVNGQKTVSIWYMNNPPTGSSLAVLVTQALSVTGLGLCAVSMSGVDLTRAPVFGTGSSATSTAASCAVSGGGTGDMQVAICSARATTTLANNGGGNQLNLALLNGINTNDAVSADNILGVNAGNFAWTLQSSGNWAAVGATIFALGNIIAWVRA